MKTKRLEKLKTRKEQLEARIKLIENKERNRQKKEDTRRKILIGAFYLEQMEKDEAVNKKILARLDGFLTRPIDRELFGLKVSQSSKKPSSGNESIDTKPILTKPGTTSASEQKRSTSR